MRLPEYLKRGIIDTEKTKTVRALLKKHSLHTICEAGRCPNKAECYAHNTASFLIMGDICTRNCRYCNVATGKPLELDSSEPEKLASTIKDLNLKYVVITSVTRDDLPDGGAEHFAKTIKAIKNSHVYIWAGATGLSDYPEAGLVGLEVAQKAGLKTIIWNVGMDSQFNPVHFKIGGKKAKLCKIASTATANVVNAKKLAEGYLIHKIGKKISSALSNCDLVLCEIRNH